MTPQKLQTARDDLFGFDVLKITQKRNVSAFIVPVVRRISSCYFSAD